MTGIPFLPSFQHMLFSFFFFFFFLFFLKPLLCRPSLGVTASGFMDMVTGVEYWASVAIEANSHSEPGGIAYLDK